MPQELVYTSVPAGLDPNTKGYCTVQRTHGLSRATQSQLEGLSGVELAALRGISKSHGIHSHTLIRIGAQPCSVLSRVAPFGQDYSGRDNKIAHHLVLPIAERPPCGPAAISSSGRLCSSWKGPPRESEPPQIRGVRGPTKPSSALWQQTTGDAGWAGHILKCTLDNPSAGMYLVVDDHIDRLALINELLSLAGPSRIWQFTFSTEFQTLPVGIQCQWRFVSRTSPYAKAAARGRLPCLDFSGSIPTSSLEYAEAARNSRVVPGGESRTTRQSSIASTPQQQNPAAPADTATAGTYSLSTFRSEPTPQEPSPTTARSTAPRHRPQTASTHAVPDTRVIAAQQAANRHHGKDHASSLKFAMIATGIVSMLLLFGGATFALMKYQEKVERDNAAIAELKAIENERKELFESTDATLLESERHTDSLGLAESILEHLEPPTDVESNITAQQTWLKQLSDAVSQADSRLTELRKSIKDALQLQLLNEAQTDEITGRLKVVVEATEGASKRARQYLALASPVPEIAKVLNEVETHLQARQLVESKDSSPAPTIATIDQHLASMADHSAAITDPTAIDQFVSDSSTRLSSRLQRIRQFAIPLEPQILSRSQGEHAYQINLPNHVGEVDVGLFFPDGILVRSNEKDGVEDSRSFLVTLPSIAVGSKVPSDFTLYARPTASDQGQGQTVNLMAEDNEFWAHPLSATLRIQLSGPLLAQLWHFNDKDVRSAGSNLFETAERAHLQIPIDGSQVPLVAERQGNGQFRLRIPNIRKWIDAPGKLGPTATLTQNPANQLLSRTRVAIQPKKLTAKEVEAINRARAWRATATKESRQFVEQLCNEVSALAEAWLSKGIVEDSELKIPDPGIFLQNSIGEMLRRHLVIANEDVVSAKKEQNRVAELHIGNPFEYSDRPKDKFLGRKIPLLTKSLFDQENVPLKGMDKLRNDLAEWLSVFEEYLGIAPAPPNASGFAFMVPTHVFIDPTHFQPGTPIFEFHQRIRFALELVSNPRIARVVGRVSQLAAAIDERSFTVSQLTLKYSGQLTDELRSRVVNFDPPGELHFSAPRVIDEQPDELTAPATDAADLE